MTSSGGIPLPPLPPQLAKVARTHRSVSSTENYEILETLGDHLLALALWAHLPDRFPNKRHKDLHAMITAVTNNEFLADLALKLGLKPILNANDPLMYTRKVYADVFEALVGAIWREHGLEKVSEWILRTIEAQIGDWSSVAEPPPVPDGVALVPSGSSKPNRPPPADSDGQSSTGSSSPKIRLAAIPSLHGHRLVYKKWMVSEPHAAAEIWLVRVFDGQTQLGEGRGPSKRKAEYNAAMDAIAQLAPSDGPSSSRSS